MLVAKGVVVHSALLVNTTVTWSPLFNVVVVKVDEVAPATFDPLICHWYAGAEPPFVGVAVKVIEKPAQIVVVDATILTAGVTEVTVICISLLTTFVTVAHGALLTMVNVILSPLLKVLVV